MSTANCVGIVGTQKLYARCPYCGCIHQHGAEDGAKLGDIGTRLSHCIRNSKSYYLRCVGIVPKALLSKALKVLR